MPKTLIKSKGLALSSMEEWPDYKHFRTPVNIKICGKLRFLSCFMDNKPRHKSSSSVKGAG
jgi:hypothetical protein